MIVNKDKAEMAARVLGLPLEGMTTRELGQAYREKSMLHHPDVASEAYDAAKWEAICNAKRILLKWLDMNASLDTATPFDACRACNGTGRVKALSAMMSKKFNKPTTTMMCVMCLGSGIQPKKEDQA